MNTEIKTPQDKPTSYWYEINPVLLEAEKKAMAKSFPKFTLGKLGDDRLYWIGELTPGIYETKFKERMTYHVMAVYNNYHPRPMEGYSSVHIYPVFPDSDELSEKVDVPLHFLHDSAGNSFFRMKITDGMNARMSRAKEYNQVLVQTAASELKRLEQWLLIYELVRIGELSHSDPFCALYEDHCVPITEAITRKHEE